MSFLNITGTICITSFSLQELKLIQSCFHQLFGSQWVNRQSSEVNFFLSFRESVQVFFLKSNTSPCVRLNPFTHIDTRRPLKTLWQKEKLLMIFFCRWSPWSKFFWMKHYFSIWYLWSQQCNNVILLHCTTDDHSICFT